MVLAYDRIILLLLFGLVVPWFPPTLVEGQSRWQDVREFNHYCVQMFRSCVNSTVEGGMVDSDVAIGFCGNKMAICSFSGNLSWPWSTNSERTINASDMVLPERLSIYRQALATAAIKFVRNSNWETVQDFLPDCQVEFRTCVDNLGGGISDGAIGLCGNAMSVCTIRSGQWPYGNDVSQYKERSFFRRLPLYRNVYNRVSALQNRTWQSVVDFSDTCKRLMAQCTAATRLSTDPVVGICGNLMSICSFENTNWPVSDNGSPAYTEPYDQRWLRYASALSPSFPASAASSLFSGPIRWQDVTRFSSTCKKLFFQCVEQFGGPLNDRAVGTCGNQLSVCTFVENAVTEPFHSRLPLYRAQFQFLTNGSNDLSLHPSTIIPQYFYIQHNAGRCVTPVTGLSVPANDTPVAIYQECDDERYVFRFTANGSLMQEASGRCLAPQNLALNPANGTLLAMFHACDSATNQFEYTTDGYLRHRASGRCLDVQGGSANPGQDTRLILSDACTVNRTKFILTPVSTAEVEFRYMTVLHSPGRCLQATNGSVSPTLNSAAVIGDGCDKQSAQFSITSHGSLLHRTSGRCLGPMNGTLTPANNTALVFHDGCESPHFRLQFNIGDGSLRHISSGLCVNPSGNLTSGSNETALVLNDNCGDKSTVFRVISGNVSSENAVVRYPVTGIPEFFYIQHRSGSCVLPALADTIPRRTGMHLIQECEGERAIYMLTSSGSFMQEGSRRCLSPHVASPYPPNGTQLVIDNLCDDPRFQFEYTSGGHIRHRSSGKCFESDTPNRGAGLILTTGSCFGNQIHSTFTLVPVPASEIESKYVTMWHSPELCLHPSSGGVNPLDNSSLRLGSDCNIESAKFRVTSTGSLLHKTSRKCLAPLSGTAPPANNTPLVFQRRCEEPHTSFMHAYITDGALIHRASGLCVNPLSNFTNGQNTTQLVLNDNCGANRMGLRFMVGNTYNSTATDVVTGNSIPEFFHIRDSAGRCARHAEDVTVPPYAGMHLFSNCDDERSVFTFNSNGTIMNEASKFCLILHHNLQGVWFLVIAANCDRSIHQFEYTIDGYIRHRDSGRCLDFSTIRLHVSRSCATSHNRFTLAPISSAQVESRYVTVQHSPGRCLQASGGLVNPTLNSAAVIGDGCDKQSAQFSITSHGSLLHRTSGRCLGPMNGTLTPANNTALVFHDGCESPHFRLQFNIGDGSLRHISSGLCVNPSGNLTSGSNETALVLNDNCGDKSTVFRVISGNVSSENAVVRYPVTGIPEFFYIQHRSGKCVRPVNVTGTTLFGHNTRAIVNQGCDDEVFVFQFNSDFGRFNEARGKREMLSSFLWRSLSAKWNISLDPS